MSEIECTPSQTAEFTAPIAIPDGLAVSLYRFAENLGEVNWAVRKTPDIQYSQSLVPEICHFLDVNIHRVNYDPYNLRAIIGLSGVDSAVAAWLAAETMRKAKKQRSVQDATLIVANF